MPEAVLILVLLYLPGHFLGGRLARKGDGWAELALLRVSAGAAVAGPVLILLALAGWFTAPVVIGSLGICAAGAWFLGSGAGQVARFSGRDLWVLGLVAGSFALYAWRPAEYLVNNRDPGVYTVVAAKLARTGDLLTRDPLVGAVAPFHEFVAGIKYPGFYIFGEDLIVPQFFPGPFAWLGLGNLAGGLWGSLYVVPIFGALSVGVAALLGRELFGWAAGLVGATLLAVGYTQIWWARHPSSEIITQFFVLSGIWLAARFFRGAGPGSGVLAGALLGGAMLVRIDGFLALAAVPAIFGYDFLTRRPLRRWIPLGVPLALFGGAALLYANTLGGRYLNFIYHNHGLKGALELAPYALVAAILAVGIFWTVRRRWGTAVGRWLEIRGRNLALVGALGVVGAALWAYFVMPVPWENLPDGQMYFSTYRPVVWVRMVWFLTPAVAVLGLAGFVMATHRPSTGRALLIGAVLGFGVMYTVLPNVAPDLPWATRRFVPTVFPGVCLLAGYAAVEFGRAVGRAWNLRAGVALVALAFAWTAYAPLPILGVRELEGAVATFDRVQREIPEARVVYMELPDRSDHFASPLEYVHEHPVLPYDRDRFREEIDDLREAGLLEDAVYITVDGGPAPLIPGLEFREMGREELNLPRVAWTLKSFPTETGELRATFRIYRVEEH